MVLTLINCPKSIKLIFEVLFVFAREVAGESLMLQGVYGGGVLLNFKGLHSNTGPVESGRASLFPSSKVTVGGLACDLSVGLQFW